jgi:cysteine desulfurase
MIYFDNNATSLLDREVAARMHELSLRQLANPSSQHQAGRQARQILEEARDRILLAVDARTMGMGSDQLLFASGGTEANNLALFGLAGTKHGSIVISAIEHPSILGAAERLEATGRPIVRLPVNAHGVVQLDPLAAMLASSTPVALVSIMSANNETGVLQPIREAAAMCRKANVLFHTDAVQMLGKSPLSFRNTDVDAMTITAHKLHGPVGIGALILRNGVTVEPQLFGGFQQLGQRPGTEAPVLADAFAMAVERVQDLEHRVPRLLELRNRLEAGIVSIAPSAVIIGVDSHRLPHTTSVSFPGFDRQALQVALDLRGIACSTGSACASGSSQPSHVLVAMGLAPDVVKGGIRFSLSINNTEEEVDRTIQAIASIVDQNSKRTQQTREKPSTMSPQ